MAYGFRREQPRRRGAAARGPAGASYVARLDAEERQLLTALMTQVASIIAPPEPARSGDEFDRLLAQAGLSHLDGDPPSDPAREAASEPTKDPTAAATDSAMPPAQAAPGSTDNLDDLDDPERDPALDRLLPDAHRDDPLLAAEFRRMAARGLRARKAANLERSIAALARTPEGRPSEEVRLDEEEAQAFVVALTDVRLVVGDRLQLRVDSDADQLELALAGGTLDAQAAWLVAVYDFLTWLQESLTQAMLDRLDDERG